MQVLSPSPPHPTDDAAVQEQLPGARPPIGEAAFTSAFEEHYPTCLRLARRLVLDDGLAHEVVQEVFLSWWRSAGGEYRAERGELAAWLSTLTHHKAVDAVRTSERHRRLVDAAGSALPHQLEQRPVEEVVWWELGTQSLVAALPALSAAQREVLGLAYVEGLTQAETADRLGIPLGTVKSRTHAGMLRLRAAVGGTWTPTGPTSRPRANGDAGLDRQDRSTAGAQLPVAVGAASGTLRDDVERCADELAQLAADETDGRPHTATLVSHAAALVDRHGEAGLYGLVVALARLVPVRAGSRQLA